jgi:ParB-like chromosome segregation protein Spo0J
MYQQHELSAAFPQMAADDFQSLKDSIENIGVQNPIALFDGKVIDGWHRYRAANDLGIDCPSVDIGDVDPRDFVLAQNKARRHITQAQLGMATTAVYQWNPKAGRPTKESSTEYPIKTNSELAAIAGVSKKTITQAKAVQSNAAPEVQEAVKRGEIGLPKAAAIAKLPQSEQAAAISKPAPKPASEPAPVNHELEDAAQAINELAAENEELRDRVAVAAMQGTEEEKAEAAQTIAELRNQIKTLEAELDATRTSRDGFQGQNSELMKQVRMLERKLKKAGG